MTILSPALTIPIVSGPQSHSSSTLFAAHLLSSSTRQITKLPSTLPLILTTKKPTSPSKISMKNSAFSNSVSSSFFYQDCPAVVSLSDVDDSGSSKKTFTLPGFLSIECANVVCCNERNAKRKLEGFDKVEFRILVSDLWFIRREIDAWNDYEYVAMYSFNVVYVISGLKMVKESDLNKWVVVNSPRFGVVIDVYVRDHIFLLVGLCLKAVMREALGFVELANEQEVGRGLNFKEYDF